MFCVFDLPILAGTDLTRERLEVRRELLCTKLVPTFAEPIRFSETLRASPAELVRAVREQCLEEGDRETLR